MHTALRLGVRVAEQIRTINPNCHICFYGLYAALNSDYLLDHGADTCIGGEYEKPLVALVEALESDSSADTRAGEDIEGIIRAGKAALPVLERGIPSR